MNTYSPGIVEQRGHLPGMVDRQRLQLDPLTGQRPSDRPVLQAASRCPQEEHLGADGPVAGGEEQRSEALFPGETWAKTASPGSTSARAARARPSPWPCPRALSSTSIHTSTPPGETVAEGEQTAAMILKAAHVASIAASLGRSRMAQLATVAQHQVRPVTVTGGGEDHVEHARCGSQALPEPG
ncbi:MAG: hypothetical protein ACYC1D_20100 [Acidimicrobiales bacterium]